MVLLNEYSHQKLHLCEIFFRAFLRAFQISNFWNSYVGSFSLQICMGKIKEGKEARKEGEVELEEENLYSAFKPDVKSVNTISQPSLPSSQLSS